MEVAITANLGAIGNDETSSFSSNSRHAIFASKQGVEDVMTIKSLNGNEAFGKSGQGNIGPPIRPSSPLHTTSTIIHSSVSDG